MKKFELITALAFVAACILVLFKVPGGTILITLSGVSLAFFYYFLGFALFNNIKPDDIFRKSAYKNTNAKRIIGAIALGWALSVLIIGSLFKLKAYPGADHLLLTGLIASAIILLLSLFNYFRKKSVFYHGIFLRIAIYGAIGLGLYATSSDTIAIITGDQTETAYENNTHSSFGHRPDPDNSSRMR